jgi:hypothetical protein
VRRGKDNSKRSSTDNSSERQSESRGGVYRNKLVIVVMVVNCFVLLCLFVCLFVVSLFVISLVCLLCVVCVWFTFPCLPSSLWAGCSPHYYRLRHTLYIGVVFVDQLYNHWRRCSCCDSVHWLCVCVVWVTSPSTPRQHTLMW